MTLIRLAEFILYHLTILKWYGTAFCQSRLYKAAIPHIHTMVYSPQCPPCNLPHLGAIPHIHTTVCSPHSVHRATCCTYEQFHTSRLRYAAHTVSTVRPAALTSNSTHPHYGMQPTQCPPCNLLHLRAIPHIHTTVCSPQCLPCNLLHLGAIPHIHTTVCSPHSVHHATCCT